MAQLQQVIHWVASDEALARCCEQWQRASCLAVDTEFMRTDTYYPLPALIQVNDGDANYLIDPVEIDQLDPLKAILSNPHIEKVFHACSEDIEVFHRLFGCVPTPIFDTQIAAAFVGEGFSVGYANLSKSMLEIELPKGETRSNWLKRPLTEAQKSYAALDVEYLWQLKDLLKVRLDENERTVWVEQECRQLTDNALQAQNPDYAINRFKSAWKLSAKSQHVLKNLSIWREHLAQQKNKPRNHIVKEKALMSLAATLPQTIADMADVEELNEALIHRYGEDWLPFLTDQTVEQRVFLQKRPPSGEQKKQISRMRDAVASLAQRLDIAPELLARKKDFESIVFSLEDGVAPEESLPSHFYDGWRQKIIAPALMESL